MALCAFQFHDVMDLIDLYGYEPVLWDPNYPEYEHEIKSDEAWERIKARMGPDYKVEDLRLVMFHQEQMYRTYKQEKMFPHDCSHRAIFRKLDSFLGKTSTYVTTANSTQVEKIGDTEDVKVKDAGVPQQEDVCGLYGKLLAEKLRRLPERKRLNLMHELDGIVLRHLNVE